MAGRVLVTGGSGYIAGFLIRRMLELGWTVHTTVRSLSKEAALRGELGGTPETLKVFGADLMSDQGWAEAVAGCSHVAHLASPFPTAVPKSADDLIVPAREGALRALRFARAEGVRRFVMTSSAAAIAYGHGPGKTLYTEEDWTDPTAPGVQPYIQSKTYAERSAREWMAANGGDMVFCTVNPVAVLGPLAGSDFAASVEIVKRAMDGSMPALPNVGFSIVDVRDIAELHLLALTAEDAKVRDGRFIGSSGPFFLFADVALVLRERLGPQARKVPKRTMPDWLVHGLALVMPPARQLLGELGRRRETSSARAQSVLGWQPRPPEDSIENCARSLIAKGIVKV